MTNLFYVDGVESRSTLFRRLWRRFKATAWWTLTSDEDI